MFTTILVQPLFNILLALYAWIPGHDFGVAVIGLTVIVRLVLWPLVTRQLHSQKAMQKLQPEIARVKKEAGGDRQKETELLMELYKERGTSPFAPLLPIIIQLPILLALVKVFNNSLHTDKISHLAYGYIQHLPFISDIIHHHTAFSPTLLGAVDLTKPYWLLALAAGLGQFFQTRQLQPHTPQMDEQAKIMSYMIFIFPVITFLFALRFPSALSLYWTVTSLMAILQQHLVLRRDAEEMEAVGENAVIIRETTLGAAVSKPKRAAKKSGKAKPVKGGAK